MGWPIGRVRRNSPGGIADVADAVELMDRREAVKRRQSMIAHMFGAAHVRSNAFAK